MRFYDFLSVTDSLCAHIFFCVLIMNQGAAQGHLDCLYQNPKLTYKNTHIQISGLGIGRTFLCDYGQTDGQTDRQKNNKRPQDMSLSIEMSNFSIQRNGVWCVIRSTVLLYGGTYCTNV